METTTRIEATDGTKPAVGLVPVCTAPVPGDAGPTPERTRRLVEAFLSGRNVKTMGAYSRDLGAFGRFIGAATVEDAARQLLTRSQGEANETVLAFRTQLAEQGKAPATVNRHLAAVRSLVALARTLGLVPWTISIQGVKAGGIRDTRGPGVKTVRRMLQAVEARRDAKGVRDVAILRLLYDLALRRSEVASLDLAHLDFEGRRIAVLGKGRSAREWRSLPQRTVDALKAWLTIRGQEAGPLFTSLDRAKKGSGRITGASVWRIVRQAGSLVGVRVWPHAIRHCSITTALDETGGDVRRVQQFSRHSNPTTVLVYDDSRRDDAGEVAELVARTV